MTSDREELESLCLEGLILTPHGWRYRPAVAADLLEEAGWIKLSEDDKQWGVEDYDSHITPYGSEEEAQRAVALSEDLYCCVVYRYNSSAFGWKRL